MTPIDAARQTRRACERHRVSCVAVSSSTDQGGGKPRLILDADIRRRAPEAGGMRQCLRARMSSGEALLGGRRFSGERTVDGPCLCDSVIAVVKGSGWPTQGAPTVRGQRRLRQAGLSAPFADRDGGGEAASAEWACCGLASPLARLKQNCDDFCSAGWHRTSAASVPSGWPIALRLALPQ